MMRYDALPKKTFVLEDYLPPSERELLYENILRNLTQFRDKWDLVRFVHQFIARRKDEATATKVAWYITKHFEKLFEKGTFVDFYVPRLAFFEVFGVLHEWTDTPSTQQESQLSLFHFLRSNKGVKA